MKNNDEKAQNEKVERRAKIDKRLDQATGEDSSYGFLARHREKLRKEGRDATEFYDGFLEY